MVLKKVVAGATVAAALTLGLAAPSASAAATQQEQAFTQALHAVASGHGTAADRALVRSRPAVAAQVVDPQAGQSGITVKSVAPTKGARAATSCTWADVWYRGRTALGFTAYVWHHYARWCHNGSAVTSWSTRYDYTTEKDSQFYVKGLLVDAKGTTGGASSYSHMQRNIENCIVKYGCIGSFAPWSKITVTRTGGYSYTGSAG